MKSFRDGWWTLTVVTCGRLFAPAALLISATLLVPVTSLAQDEPVAKSAESTSAVGVESDSEQADREALLAMRESLVQAILDQDIEKQIEFVRPDVVTVWQNNVVARGHQGVKSFMEGMQAGNEDVFRGYASRPQSDDVVFLPGGQVAIAYGTSVPKYRYLGLDFELDNRWTATVVKENGEWKIASYHVSANLADNPFLTAAKQSLYWVGGIALLIGLIVGWVAAKFLGTRRPAV